jgi:DNA (cytosine-5)-methyltransferase 1
MTHFLDLFSGIGGFALGAYWAGLRFDNHYYSEVDKYAIRVYQQRFPDAIGLGDICKISGRGLPAGDWIISGGFPCQDISVAGKGAGLAGARSGLWFEMLRLIGDLQPRFVVVENVGALLVRGIDTVLGSLAEIGYDAEWQIISAASVGAPHRRERVYIVAYPKENGWGNIRVSCDMASEIREKKERGDQSSQAANDRRANVAYAEGGKSGEPSERKGREDSSGRSKKINELANSSNSGNVWRDGQLEPTQGQVREHRGSAENGRGEWWAVEPDVGRVANGVPSRVDRLKCLGNAIVPQCAEVIFNLPAFDEWRHA